MSLFRFLCVVDEMSITETKIKAHHGKKRNNTIELPDRDGLVASCGRSGKVTWSFRYRYNKKQRRLKVGTYPAMTLEEAREAIIPLMKAVAVNEDPKYITPDGKVVTMEYCAQQWLEIKVVSLRERTQILYKSAAGKYFTNERFPHDIKKARFEYWLAYFDRIAKETSRVNAGNIFKTLSTMLRWCKSRNIINQSVLFDIELKAIGDRPNVGQRNLQMNEIGLLWAEINKNTATLAIRSCCKLLVIFGARNSEIREARRSEFDLDSGIWTLPAARSKINKAIRRPIPDLARRIISELDETYGPDGFLIPGSHRGTFMTTHSLNRFTTRMWGRLHTAYKIEKFTPHDYRRTIATRLSEREVLPHVTEKMLGHELGGVMAVYNKHDWIDEQLIAYELWCDMITKANKAALSRL